MNTRYVQASSIVERKVRDEHLLVPLHGQNSRLDSLYTLNETAAFVWNAIAEHLTAGEIASRLAEEYDVDTPTARSDVENVIRELIRIGAITPAPPPSAS